MREELEVLLGESLLESLNVGDSVKMVSSLGMEMNTKGFFLFNSWTGQDLTYGRVTLSVKSAKIEKIIDENLFLVEYTDYIGQFAQSKTKICKYKVVERAILVKPDMWSNIAKKVNVIYEKNEKIRKEKSKAECIVKKEKEKEKEIEEALRSYRMRK